MNEIPALSGETMTIPVEAVGGERACVLVVDDNPGKLLSLSAIISGMPLEVATAVSGRAALRCLLERDFALILLDVNMPALDGYETARLIHGRPRSAHTPIIFITAEAATDNEQFRGYTAGAVDWVFSPIIPAILQAKVKVFVDLYHLTRIAQVQTEQLRQRAIEIERKNAQLEEVSRLKSSFLASMSHELRTPLNAIIGFAALLKDGFVGSLTTKQKDAVCNVHNAGNHLLSLVNDILDLSKVEAGQMELELESAPLGVLLEDSLTVVRERAVAQRVQLRLQLEPNLGAVALDARKVRQILFNLLSNAVKFTPDGGLVCLAARRVARAAVLEEAPPNVAARVVPLPANEFSEFLEIEVSDNGIGISEADMRRLFNSFVQLDSSSARRFEGTGLGLALVRQLAALHGGTVGVYSAPGVGSRFMVWLPWRPADMVDATPAVGQVGPLECVHSEQRASDAAPLALVIEDNEQSAQILAAHLGRMGFRVAHARDAETGLAQALGEPPALIMLDVLLPGMDGWTALERLKFEPATAAIPVVIVTLLAENERGYALGAFDVLQKPVAHSALAQVIGRLGLAGGQRKPLVLAVVDDPGSMALMAASLTAVGCDAVRACGGQEAIATAQQILPDLVILDLMMPTIDGFDIIEALRARPETANVPILILTAKEMTLSDCERLNGYVVGIMQRSVLHVEGLEREVNRAMGRREPSRMVEQEG